MAYKTKTISVLTVAILLTAGVGLIMFVNEDTEAVTTDTPYGQVVGNTSMLLYGTNGSQTSITATNPVAVGTYFEITDIVTGGYTYDIVNINGSATAQGQSYAGLTIQSNGVQSNGVKGTFNNSGSVTSFYITWVMYPTAEPLGEETYTTTFNVADMSSSSSDPWTSMDISANLFWNAYYSSTAYVQVNSSINISAYVTPSAYSTDNYTCDTVTAGFGLSVSNGTLSGTVTSTGTITLVMYYAYVPDGSTNSESFTIEVVSAPVPSHADVRMIGGETWTYTPQTNMVSVLSISGTATSWVSLSGGTVSGTAPSNTVVGQTYDLTITASTSNPSQNATQTITFTVDPQITLTAPATYTVQFGTDTSNVLGSNFEDGTRNIYSITGGTATGFTVNAATGVLGWNNPAAGTITFTATSPYTYTSGATNTATATMDVTVTGILTASVSGTLYLVTGKTVPNTPAEAVTLNHNDVGSGTYTWAVAGTNSSGVTVASDGTLGGTPGAVGSYSVTVRCTSVVGGVTQTADATLNVVIVAVLVFTSTPRMGTFS